MSAPSWKAVLDRDCERIERAFRETDAHGVEFACATAEEAARIAAAAEYQGLHWYRTEYTTRVWVCRD